MNKREMQRKLTKLFREYTTEYDDWFDSIGRLTQDLNMAISKTEVNGDKKNVTEWIEKGSLSKYPINK